MKKVTDDAVEHEVDDLQGVRGSNPCTTLSLLKEIQWMR